MISGLQEQKKFRQMVKFEAPSESTSSYKASPTSILFLGSLSNPNSSRRLFLAHEQEKTNANCKLIKWNQMVQGFALMGC